MKFDELKLNKTIATNIKNLKFDETTKIQELVIPEVLSHFDVIAKAQTGSGKTAAYLIPILNHLIESKKEAVGLKAVILVPTRDLVNQVYELFEKLSVNTNFKAVKVMGGTSKSNQIDELKEEPDILISVVGRLNDFINKNLINFKNIEFFVLDEMDKMLDLGFRSHILRLHDLIIQKNKFVQSILLSATLPQDIENLAKKILKPNLKIIKTEEQVNINDLIDQKFYVVNKKNLNAALYKIVLKNNVKTIIFTNTINESISIESLLKYNGIDCACINGNRSQAYRDRIINSFKDNEISVLIATDVLSRGIDIKDLDLVINFNLPDVDETFIHRIGRVGRANNKGKAYTIVDLESENRIKNLIAKNDFKAKIIHEK